MANVKVITANEKDNSILRVAAYCRVSSDSADQLNSYAAQIRAYTDKINDTEGWQLVDVYADEGLTGIKTDKREEFKRLMKDCSKGKIDKVLVKSISRFARNTEDCLSALRELKLLGISVCFEKENIDTETLTDELAVSVFGSLAQQESVSVSENQLWSYKKRMESGEFITCSRPYGYQIKNGKDLEIIEDEAEIVRWIFQSFLNGLGTVAIANELNRRSVPTTCKKAWGKNSVRYILSNEKYIGDSLSQKSYTTRTFPSRSRQNHGDMPMYYVENTHPAIISKEEFKRVRKLIELRRRDGYINNEYPLSRVIVCGECGSTFKRRASAGPTVWVCRNHDISKQNCTRKPISEAEIYDAFVRLYNKLKSHGDQILRPVLSQLLALRDAASRNDPAMLEITSELAKLSEQEHIVAQLRSKGLIDADAYVAKCNAFNSRIAGLRKKRRELLAREDDDSVEQIKLLMRIIESGPQELERFDESTFADMVEKICATADDSLEFTLLGGIKFNERVWRDKR